MKGLLIATAMQAGVGGGPTAADPFCEDVRALAAGAEESDPFRSLPTAITGRTC